MNRTARPNRSIIMEGKCDQVLKCSVPFVDTAVEPCSDDTVQVTLFS